MLIYIIQQKSDNAVTSTDKFVFRIKPSARVIKLLAVIMDDMSDK